ncbi:MAG: hypothetical protein ACYS76_14185 [Planctomycetota bacterium]|jgi:hypothetical protein
MIIIDRVVVRNIYHHYRLIDAGAVNQLSQKLVGTAIFADNVTLNGRREIRFEIRGGIVYIPPIKGILERLT